MKPKPINNNTINQSINRSIQSTPLSCSPPPSLFFLTSELITTARRQTDRQTARTLSIRGAVHRLTVRPSVWLSYHRASLPPDGGIALYISINRMDDSFVYYSDK